MHYRTLGKSGLEISSVSFGAWALGGDFGTVTDAESKQAIVRALELGVNFFDTADVYGDGRSERILGEVKRSTKADMIIATKAGRRLKPHVASGYDLENLTAFVDRSLTNLRVEALDLVQLHCPPTDVYYMPEVFEALDVLKQRGKLRHYGVSVERVEEALKAIEYPGVTSVQIIYNLLRQRPSELFFERAAQRQVGVLARLPLSSGMLGGRINASTAFEPSDHRNYNRNGEAFDRGETFSGVPFEAGLAFVERLRNLVPNGTSIAAFSLRWALMQDAVTAVIPGAKRPSQVEQNVGAAALPPLPQDTLRQIEALYREHIRPLVHQRW
ncbi:MAG TPA: aldo/keto reductase [Polyangiaceae bacterium]